MNDLISRQAAIDVVNGIDSNFAKYIEELPSAQPEQRWIPVSERLPEGGHNIIFCDSKGNVCEGVYHAMLGQWVGFRWDSIYHHADVIAWMPLPDPYKGEV